MLINLMGWVMLFLLFLDFLRNILTQGNDAKYEIVCLFIYFFTCFVIVTKKDFVKFKTPQNPLPIVRQFLFSNLQSYMLLPHFCHIHQKSFKGFLGNGHTQMMFLATGDLKTKSYRGLRFESYHETYGNNFFPIRERYIPREPVFIFIYVSTQYLLFQ